MYYIVKRLACVILIFFVVAPLYSQTGEQVYVSKTKFSIGPSSKVHFFGKAEFSGLGAELSLSSKAELDAKGGLVMDKGALADNSGALSIVKGLTMKSQSVLTNRDRFSVIGGGSLYGSSRVINHSTASIDSSLLIVGSSGIQQDATGSFNLNSSLHTKATFRLIDTSYVQNIGGVFNVHSADMTAVRRSRFYNEGTFNLRNAKGSFVWKSVFENKGGVVQIEKGEFQISDTSEFLNYRVTSRVEIGTGFKASSRSQVQNAGKMYVLSGSAIFENNATYANIGTPSDTSFYVAIGDLGVSADSKFNNGALSIVSRDVLLSSGTLSNASSANLIVNRNLSLDKKSALRSYGKVTVDKKSLIANNSELHNEKDATFKSSSLEIISSSLCQNSDSLIVKNDVLLSSATINNLPGGVFEFNNLTGSNRAKVRNSSSSATESSVLKALGKISFSGDSEFNNYGLGQVDVKNGITLSVRSLFENQGATVSIRSGGVEMYKQSSFNNTGLSGVISIAGNLTLEESFFF